MTLFHDDARITSRILVVEPDDDTRALYRQSLQLVGCEVVEAFDGRDALVKALTCHPALVVTETRLPFFDGYALCELLRRDSTTRSVPILVITTEIRPTHLERIRAVGADAVLIKPATLDALLNEIRRLLTSFWESPRNRATATTAAEHPAGVLARSEVHLRVAQVKTHLRFETTTPPERPPSLVCPSCDRPLRYQRSYVGGVSTLHAEQWDEFVCQTPTSCGIFEYRQRTRKLRRACV